MTRIKVWTGVALVVLAATGCSGGQNTAEASAKASVETVSPARTSGELRAACTGRVKQLFGACRDYANDHGGAFPEKLSRLWPDYVKDLTWLSCPASGHAVSEPARIDQESDFEIVPNPTKDAGPGAVLLRDKADYHEKPAGRTVCAATGAVQFVKAQ
jgi:hypothetical protein